MVRSERSELAVKLLISLNFYAAKRSVYPSLYLTLYPRAEPREQSSTPCSIAERCHHDKSRLKMAPIPSSAQST
jgi:hypothetical protein